MKRILKWTGIVAGALLLLLVALAGILLIYLGTDSGRDWALKQARQIIESDADVEIRVGETQGHLLDSIVLTDIVVRDPDGDIATIEKLELAWQPSALFGRRLVVDRLTATHPVIHRPIASTTQSEEDPFAFPDLGLPVDVVINRIAVSQLALQETVAGQSAQFDLSGRASVSRTLDDLRVRFEGVRTDRPGDRLRIRIVADPAAGSLDLDLGVEEAPGGILSILAGFEDAPGLTLRLAGSGDLAEWRGRLSATIGSSEAIDQRIVLRGGERLHVETQGLLRPGILFPDLRALGEEWQLTLTGALGLDSLVVENLELQTAAAHITGSGRSGQNGDSFAVDLTVTAENLDAFSELAGQPLSGRARLDFALSGSREQPRAEMTLDAEDVALEAFRVRHIRVRASFQPQTADASSGLWSGDLKVDASALRTVANSNIEKQIVESLSLESDATLDLVAGRAELGNLDLRVDFLGATGRVAYDWARQNRVESDLTLRGIVPPELTGGVQLGDASFNLISRIEIAGLTGTARLNGQVASIVTGTPEVDALLQGPATLEAEADLNAADVIVRRLRASGAHYSLTADGNLSANASSHLEATLRTEDLSVLSSPLGQPVMGALQVRAILSGDPDRLQADAAISGDGLAVGATEIGELRGRIESANLLADAPVADIRFETDGPIAPQRAAARIEFVASGDVRISEIEADAFGTEVRGNVLVLSGTGTAQGELRFNASDLAATGEPFGEKLAGNASGAIRLLSDNDVQAVTIEARLQEFRRTTDAEFPVSIDQAIVNGRVADVAALNGMDIRVNVSGARASDVTLETFEIVAAGQLDNAEISIVADGQSEGVLLALNATAQVDRRDQTMRIQLSAIDGRYDTTELSLLAPGTISISGNNYGVEPLRLAVGGGTVTFQGMLQSERLEAEIVLSDVEANAFAETLGGRLDGTIMASGPLERPTIQVNLSGTELGTPAIRAQRATLRTTLRPEQGNALAGPWSGQLELGASVVREIADGTPGPEIMERLSLVGDVAFDIDAGNAAVTGIELRTDQSRATGNVSYDWGDDGRLVSDLAIRGSPPPALTGGVWLGATTLDLRADLDTARMRGSATLSGRFASIATGTPAIDSLLEGPASLDAEIRLGDNALAIERLRASGRHYELSGGGSVAEGEDGNVEVNLRIPDLSVMSPALGKQVSGQIEVAVNLSGTTERIEGTATVEGSGLAYGGNAIGGLRLRAQSSDVTVGRPEIALRIETDGPVTPQRASARIAFLENGAVQLAGIEADAAGVRLNGGLTVSLASGTAEGELTFAADSLEQAGALAGEDLGGSVEGSLRLTTSQDAQSVAISARIDEFRRRTDQSFPIAAGTATIEGRIENLDTLAGADIRFVADEAVAGQIAFTTLRLAASGGANDTTVTITAEGERDRIPLALNAEANVVREDNTIRIGLERLDGEYDRAEVALRRNATIEIGPRRSSVEQLRLAIGDGTVALDGTLGGERIEAELRVEDLPAATLEKMRAGPPLDGTFSGTATVSGPLERLEGELSFAANGLRSAQLGDDAPTSDIDINGRLASGRLTLEARARGFGDEPFRLDADLPFVWDGEIPDGARVAGNMSGPLDLAQLARLQLLGGHRAAGTLDVRMEWSGTYGNPDVSGRARIENGEFENIRTGTLLREIAMTIETNGTRLTLDGTASDGGDGRVEIAGNILLDGSRGFPFEARIRTSQANLLRRDEIVATITSDLESRGDFRQGLEITGSMTVNQSEITIPERLPPDVVIVEVEERNVPPILARRQRNIEEERPPLPIRVDISVDVPRRTFVRGRGIDSEWEGDLRITGQVPTPQVSGTLETVRGAVDLLGARFEVERGTIRFDRGDFADPSIFMRAVNQREALRAIIEVTGSAQDPKINITSEPERPQEEVLSQVLFGEEVNRLSPLQAARLAAAAAQLFGPGGSTGVISRVRTTLGLDVLEVAGEDTSGTNVRVGRYVGDRTLVRVEQGIQPGSSRVGVEVEVFDNLVLESDVGAQGDTRVGIQFRTDY